MPSFLRKFLVKTAPDISRIPPIQVKKLYLYNGDSYCIFIEKNGDALTLNRAINPLYKKEASEPIVIQITQEEFEGLQNKSDVNLIYNAYKFANDGYLLKIYEGNFSSLIIAEVYFDTVENANAYQPAEFMGKDITQTPLGNEYELLELSSGTFRDLLNLYLKESFGKSPAPQQNDSTPPNDGQVSQFPISSSFKDISSILH